MPKSIDNSTNNLTTGEAKILALLIGVNQYQDANIYNLKYCANDCDKLAAALQTSTKLFPNKTIQFHRDHTENPPYLKTVRHSLDTLIATAGKLDTIIIYFSGHGILEPETKQPVLCLTDTQKDDLIKTGLPVTELLEKLAASEAKYQLLFLDACHSGGLNLQQFVSQKKGTEEITVPPINPTPELIDILQRRASKSKGFYALLSCDKNQESLEFPELGHGLFTYYLIRGLLGEAADEQGVIEADALYKYVYHRTLEYIDKTNQQIKLINQQKRGRGEDEQKPFSWQTPRRIVEGAGEFVLGLTGRRSSGECLRRSLFINSLPDCEETVSLAGIFSSRGGFEVDYFPGRDRSWEDVREAI
ncbi:MAG: hypothetical protein F6K35_28715, partial [Okeania sp. SIO2H7]|nr:hypothetical protein [Okeania sp. SIO2H7]